MAVKPGDELGVDALTHPLDREDHDEHLSDPHSGRTAQEQVLDRIEHDRKRRPKFMDDRITMAHGAGGKATRQLVEGVFVPKLRNDILATLSDAAALNINGQAIAFTTDSYVVKPILFPGGSIGELAINGTVNDLAVSGARAMWVSCGFIIEEGLGADVIKREASAMAAAAQKAGVQVVTGDTKVVERGK